jgi:hypothetical protein
MTDSHLILRLATPTESRYIRDQNAASWAGDLPVETYHKREHVLASTALTRNGGIECWVLIDPSKPSEVLTSCETIKKPAYISRPPVNGDKICNVVEVYAHGLGSVYTPECQRKKGYCQEMLRLIKEHMMKENPEGFNVLYSDIGKVSPTRSIPMMNSNMDCANTFTNSNSTPNTAGSRTDPLTSNFPPWTQFPKAP